ncbi:MAG: glycoside hydrolase [Candidatus Firestonebacteria bacterium]|nr:glycoside hydrolase [Candidatus Firestonebacteria bacterium]
MTVGKLNVAFLWHMHQPFYKDILTNEYAMPWVRLHAIKDYYDMVTILEPFENIHQTFNLVPSLIEQIKDYTDNKAQDNVLRLTCKPAGELTIEEKTDILIKLFMANWETMIKIYPRYKNLLEKRGEHISIDKLRIIQNNLTTQDFLDLQVWYNLAWFDPIFKKNDTEIARLIEKNEKFTEEDKNILIAKQMEIMGMILPVYKKFMDKGQIEISISPYYHPILPLLIDTDIARISSPDINLPKEKFQHIEDARWHIEEAVKYYKYIFGTNPKGMWPSEGSVSEEIIPLISENGIKWIATDEKILKNSFYRTGEIFKSDSLYRAYRVEKNNRAINIVFRDLAISDKIGFIYSNWKARDAVNDFVEYLYSIKNRLPCNYENYLVSIILDGENAWEYYPKDGREFLLTLYERLNQEEAFKFVTVSEYLESSAPQKLSYLFPGSWINSNYNIWIGHKEDNMAWDYLSLARKALIKYQNKHIDEKNSNVLTQAWKEIYIAEGSDWCWWYGDEFASLNRMEFDSLFRKHLINVYQLIGEEIPYYLYLPISQKPREIPFTEPTAFINPIIDGKVSHYYEWLSAGFYDIQKISGTMHQTETIIKKIYYGLNYDSIFIRMDLKEKLPPEVWDKTRINIYVLNPRQFKIDIEVSLCDYLTKAALFKENESEMWEKVKDINTVALNEIIEIGILKKDIGLQAFSRIEFMLIVFQGNMEIEHWPIDGTISFGIVPDDLESLVWML